MAKLEYSKFDKIYCFGDSLTQNGSDGKSYPENLQNLLGDKIEVVNMGISSRTSGQIAVMQGGTKIQLDNPDPIVLKGDTTTVNVPFRLVPSNGGNIKGGHMTDLYDNGVRFDWLKSSDGKHADVKQFNKSDSDVTLPANYAFKQMAEGSEQYVNILWSGRNDIAFTGGQQAVTGNTGAVDAMVQHLKDAVKFPRFIVIGVPYRMQEYPGVSEEDGYKLVTQMNDQLKAHYPDNYLDLCGYLINHGLEDTGIEPTQDDLDHIAAGTMPPSLMAPDGTHPNAAAKVVEAQQIYNFIQKKGYDKLAEDRSEQYLKALNGDNVAFVGDKGSKQVDVTGLEAGREIPDGYYKVRFDADGNKSLSAQASDPVDVPGFTVPQATTTTTTVKPTAPLAPNLVYVGNSAKLDDDGKGQAAFNGKAVDADGSVTAVDKFTIYYAPKDESEGEKSVDIEQSDMYSSHGQFEKFWVQGMTLSKQYQFFLTASNDVGESDRSSAQTATMPDAQATTTTTTAKPTTTTTTKAPETTTTTVKA